MADSGLRLDKYLWYVRIAKTRSQAAGLAAEGHLRIDSRPVTRAHAPVRIGQVLMAAGALVAISHWIAHLAATGQGPSITEDIFIGYPTGGLLLLFGAVIAGRTETKKR